VICNLYLMAMVVAKLNNMALSVVSLVSLAMQASAVTRGCSSDLDCSLNGACVQGTCICDAAWGGESCGQLQLLPADLTEGYDHLTRTFDNNSVASWGATQVVGDDGLYHTYVGELTGHCGIEGYETNEQIVHATSQSREGPWQRQGPVMGPVAVCPHATRSHDGLWLIFHTGCGNYSDPRDHHIPRKDCSNGTTPPSNRLRGEWGCGVASDFASVFYGPTPEGPWQQHRIDVPKVTINGVSWPNYTGNPSPLILANGTTLLMFRNYIRNETECLRIGGKLSTGSYPGCTLIGVARAPHWRGPYEVVPGPIIPTQQEDPNIYKTSRGFHAVFHGMDPWPSKTAVGRHAYSLDGLTWFGGTEDAFSDTVQLRKGEIQLRRRERPEMVLDDFGNPTALISAVQTPADWVAGDQTFTLIQRVRTALPSTIVV